MTTHPRPRAIADLDVPAEVLEARLREGLAAEYRHLLHDPDADSTVPALVVSLTKPGRAT